MTGSLSLRASKTARCSFLVSTIHTAEGTLAMSRIPPRVRSSLILLALHHEELLLGATRPGDVVVVDLLELLQTRQPLADRVEVGEHATEPAVVDVGHPDAHGLLGDGLLGLLLRADEEDGATVGDRLLDELVGVVDVGQRLLQVDDVDAVALGHDEALHLRVPASGLVPEVDAALEELAHGDDGHAVVSLSFVPVIHESGGIAVLVPGACDVCHPEGSGTAGRTTRRGCGARRGPRGMTVGRRANSCDPRPRQVREADCTCRHATASLPGMGNPLVERMQGFGTTIFAEMSALAAEHRRDQPRPGLPRHRRAAARCSRPRWRRSTAGATSTRRGRACRSCGPRSRRTSGGSTGSRSTRDREVLVTAGATEAIAAVVLALCEPGDEVVTFEPYYDSYAATIALAGAVRRTSVLRFPDFAVDEASLRAAFSAANPAGAAQHPAQPDRQGVHAGPSWSWSARWRASTTRGWSPTRSTSTWSSTGPSTSPWRPCPGWRSAPSPSPRRGKTFSATGWKVGWVTGPAAAVAAARTVKQFLTYVGQRPVPAGGGGGARARRRGLRRAGVVAAGQAGPAVRGAAGGRAAGVAAGRDLLRHRRRGAARGDATRWRSAAGCRRCAGWSGCRCRCSTTTSRRPARWCGSRSASGTTCCTRRSADWPRSRRAETRASPGGAHGGAAVVPRCTAGDRHLAAGRWRPRPWGHEPAAAARPPRARPGDGPHDGPAAAAGPCRRRASPRAVVVAAAGSRPAASGSGTVRRCGGSPVAPAARCALPGRGPAVRRRRPCRPTAPRSRLDLAAVAPARGAPAVRRPAPAVAAGAPRRRPGRDRSASRYSAAGAGTVTFSGVVAGRGVVSVRHAGGLRTTYEPVDRARRGGHGRAPAADGSAPWRGPGHCRRRRACTGVPVEGDTYRDPLTLIDPGRPVLLPLR